MSTRVIVTGGAGFIGRNVVAGLNARGVRDILVVDQLGQDEKWTNLIDLHFEDLIDKDAFLEPLAAEKFGDIDAVLHLGACSSTTETDADYLLNNNYRYTRTLCEWCLAHDVRFIAASSAATYGDGSQGYSDDDEATPSLKPLNMYGYSKHMFDLWALQHELYRNIVGLKYFNVYGPYEDHKGDMRSVVHKAFGQIINGGTVSLFKSYNPEYADGEQVRDFVYVWDAVDVTLYFYEHRDVSGLFNCGTGRARSWKDLATAVFAALDKEPSIEYIDMPDNIRDKYQYFTQADMTKLRAAGYTKPFTSLEDGIDEYVREYLIPRHT